MRGLGVSPGIAVGHALVVERRAVPVFRLLVPPEAVEGRGRAPAARGGAVARAARGHPGARARGRSGVPTATSSTPTC